MWYSGETPLGIDNIGLATSSDGKNWVRYSQNPVLKVGSGAEWDSGSVNQASVIYDNGMYKMWYSGQLFEPRNKTILAIAVGYATSPDGVSWTKYAGNPVLTAGSAGEWDDKWVFNPTVISTGQSYMMWYRGLSKAGVSQTGLAVSDDGVRWTKKGPISLPRGASGWDNNYAFPFITGVMKAGEVFVGMYHANKARNDPLQIGGASSSDGITWIPYPHNPVILPGSWDAAGVEFPMILIVGNDYYVYYSSSRAGVGLAVLPMSQYPIPEFPGAMAILISTMISALLLSRYGRRIACSFHD